MPAPKLNIVVKKPLKVAGGSTPDLSKAVNKFYLNCDYVCVNPHAHAIMHYCIIFFFHFIISFYETARHFARIQVSVVATPGPLC